MDEFNITSPLGKTVKVRGYEVKRCRIGKMLEALELVAQVPAELAAAVMKGIAKQDGSDQGLSALVAALTYAPKPMLDIISRLLEIPCATLLDDPEIGLMGLLEMLGAWAEVNELENFTGAVRAILRMGRGESMDSSQQDCTWASAKESCSRIITLGRLARCLRPGRS